MIQSIVVLGGGSAGLIAALTLKRHLPQLNVRVIRSPEIGIIGVGEGTTLDFPRHFFEYLGLKPRQFYKEAEPTWKLGIRFLWGPEPDFFYTFTTEYEHRYADLPRNTGFYQTEGVRWVGKVSACMAHDKAFPRRPDGAPDFSIPHGFHIENAKLVRWLENVCRAHDVSITEDTMRDVERAGESITALLMESGERVVADLFVDASGFRSELLGRALGEPYVSYDQSLLCDRAIIGGWPRTNEPIHPYTTAETMEAGWCWQIEHEHWINRGYVYSSRFLSDDAALAELMAKNPQIANEPRIVKFRSGRYDRAWVGNIVAIGNAAGFVEPLEATALHVLCAQSRWLVETLLDRPPLPPTPATVSIYNQLNATFWNDIRDFLAIHYAFNTRLDTPFWKACRAETDLGGIARLVEFFRENGPSALGKPLLHPQNSFGLNGHLAMLCGQRVPHERPHSPSTEEAAIWKAHIDRLAGETRTGLSVKQTLDLIRGPKWKWP